MTAAPPLDALARTALLYGGGLTLWLAAGAARRQPVSAHQQAAAGLFWLATAAVAIAHLIGVLGDRGSHDVAVSIAYAVAAVLVMPVLWLRDGAGAGAGDGAGAGAGAAKLPALATGVTVVLILRLGAVW